MPARGENVVGFAEDVEDFREDIEDLCVDCETEIDEYEVQEA